MKTTRVTDLTTRPSPCMVLQGACHHQQRICSIKLREAYAVVPFRVLWSQFSYAFNCSIVSTKGVKRLPAVSLNQTSFDSCTRFSGCSPPMMWTAYLHILQASKDLLPKSPPYFASKSTQYFQSCSQYLYRGDWGLESPGLR